MKNLVYRLFVAYFNVVIFFSVSCAAVPDHTLEHCPHLQGLPVVRIEDNTPITTQLIHQLIHKVEAQERLIQTLAATTYIPPDVLLMQNATAKEQLFRMVLCRRLSQMFGLTHLGIDSPYTSDSLSYIGLKLTINLALNAVLGLIPGLPTITQAALTDQNMIDFFNTVVQKLQTFVTGLAEEQLEQFALAMLRDMASNNSEHTNAQGGTDTFIYFTTFASLDKASVLVASKLSTIYAQFINVLEDENIRRLAESAAETIRYYFSEKLPKEKATINLTDIIDAVGYYYPVNKYKFELYSANPQRNGFVIRSAPEIQDSWYDMDMLIASAITVGGDVYVCPQGEGKNYYFKTLGFFKKGIVYTTICNRHENFRNLDGTLLTRNLDHEAFRELQLRRKNSWILLPRPAPIGNQAPDRNMDPQKR